MKILDESGKRVTTELAHLLKVRKKKISVVSMWWSCYPHNLKTYIAYIDKNDASIDKIKVPHGEPKKEGSGYTWEIYHHPPLRRGQKIWVIDEFDMHNEYTKDNIRDFFDSFRKIKKFIWKVHLPPGRPAKRWYGAANFLPNREDDYILAEDNRTTTEVVWEFNNTKKGAVYYLNIDW